MIDNAFDSLEDAGKAEELSDNIALRNFTAIRGVCMAILSGV